MAKIRSFIFLFIAYVAGGLLVIRLRTLFLTGLLGLLIIPATVAFADEQTLDISLGYSAQIPWNVSNMIPQDMTSWQWLEVKNDGAVPASIFFYIDNMLGSPDDSLGDFLYFEMKIAPSATNGDCTSASAHVLFDGVIRDLEGLTSALSITPSGQPYMYQPGESVYICQRAYLPAATGNEAQDLSLNFDEIIFATNDTSLIKGDSDENNTPEQPSFVKKITGQVLGASVGTGNSIALVVGVLAVVIGGYLGINRLRRSSKRKSQP